MGKEQYMDRAEHALYKIYNRFPVVFDRGEGVYLYDTDGTEYLDFGAELPLWHWAMAAESFRRQSRIR